MPSITCKPLVKSASISATVIRNDGTREELGVVSYWHRNPLKRWAWWIRQNIFGR